MKEKEIVIPIRFPVKIGKFISRPGEGITGAVATISVKTKGPIVMAYFYLAFKALGLGMRRILAS
jgi:hypothetical protein